MKRIPFVILLFFFSSVVFAAACDTKKMPAELYELIEHKKLDEALQQAKARYDQDPDNKENALVLARVYINVTLQSGISMDMQSLGFKPGESGSKKIDMAKLKQATREITTVNESTFNEADQFIRQVVTRWPESNSFYYCLTKMHFYKGEFDSFIKLLSQTAEFNKHNQKEAEDFLLGYGMELINQDRLSQAAEVYKTLLNTFPKSAPLLSSLGVTYINRGFTERAQFYFEKAYDIDNNDVIVIGNIAEAAMLMADNTKAESFLLKKAKMIPDKAEIYFDLAVNAMQKEPKAASRYWKRYFEIHEKHPDNEQWAKNAKVINNLINSDSSNTDTWFDLAQQMINAQVTKYAVPVLYYVDKQRPGDAVVSYSMAHAYDVGQNYDLQEKALLLTLKRLDKPGNKSEINREQVYFNLARSTYVLNKYDAALGYLENISPRGENYAQAAYLKGLIYRDTGKKDKAREYFKTCIDKATHENIRKYCQDQIH